MYLHFGSSLRTQQPNILKYVLKCGGFGVIFQDLRGRCDMRHSISDFGTYFSQSARLHDPRQICVFQNALRVAFCRFRASAHIFRAASTFQNAFGARQRISERIWGCSPSVGSNQFSTFFGTNFRSTNRLILSRLLLSSLCPSLHGSPAPRWIDRLNQPHAIRIRRHAPCSLLMIE